MVSILRISWRELEKNATYTSKVAVTEFVEAIGQWVQEVLLTRIHRTSMFSSMADECTNISTVEELSIYCHTVTGLKMEFQWSTFGDSSFKEDRC